MLDRFLGSYAMTSGKRGARAGTRLTVEGLHALYGGCSFDRGLYRIHSPASGTVAAQLVVDMFPTFDGCISSFGFDWLGRQFCVDLREQSDDPPVLMFEPGTGEVLEIPVKFSAFHDQELVDYAEAALAKPFFEEWLLSGTGRDLAFHECVGYRVPLFLGGTDTVPNLEVIGIDVYWTLSGQLWQGARRMEPGTTISQLRIES